MKNITNKLVGLLYKHALQPNKGKLSYQSIFERLYRIGLEGMNYNSSKIGDNGETYCIDYLARALRGKQNITIFDVGANKGDYTAALLDRFDRSDLKIYSFEPSEPTFQQFKENITDQRVSAFNLGMGAKTETLKLYKTEKSSGLSSLYQRNLEHFDITMDVTEEIKITTLDEFCEAQQVSEISFLKMDVEGHESKVLEGASDMLSRDSVKYIQFEFGGCNIDSRTYFQDFYYVLKDKYQFYRIVHDGLYPIREYREDYEIFKTINFLAKHKSMP